MAEEISLSIGETNKLRAKIGLAPIPVENEIPQAEQAIATTHEISIEETNRLRESIGLGPIPVDDSSSTVSREDEELRNYRQHQSVIEKKRREDELKQRIEEAKSKSRKRKALNGRTLLDDEEEDTDAWLENLGKNDPKKAKVVKSAISVSKPDTGDVADVRIAHSLQQIHSLNDNDILTLDDADILEEDSEVGGVLTNEKLSKSMKLKKELHERAEAENVKFNGRHYKASNLFGDKDDGDEDEETEGIRSGVILKAGSSIPLKSDAKTIPPIKTANKIQLRQLFRDIDEDDEVSLNTINDYAKEKPISMKKMKKKFKSKSKVVRHVLDEEGIPAVKFKKFDDDAYEDEELALHKTLDEARRNKQKKRSVMSPEDIAAEIVKVQRQEIQDGVDDGFKQGVVFDDTTDFLTSLSSNLLDSTNGNVKVEADNMFEGEEVKIKQEEGEGSVSVKQEPTDDSIPAHIKQEPADASIKIKQESTDDSIAAQIKQEIKTEDDKPGSEAEDDTPQFGGGLASTLKFLHSRNILNQATEQEKASEKKRQEAIKHSEMLKIKISIEERILKEELEADKSYMNLPKVERSEIFEKLLDEKLNQKGIVKEITQVKKNANRGKFSKYSDHRINNSDSGASNNFTSYNPQVKLSYHDDTGNELNTKEAYKYLSHQFHGVGPSKNKQEKQKQRVKHESPTSSLHGKVV